jgi:general secretion pathway protein G
MNIQSSAPAQFRNARRAFTLLEILVVLAIIGLLVGVAVSGVGNALDRSRVSTTRIFITSTLKSALGQYKLDNYDYPSTADGLQALLTPPATATNWHGPYLDLSPAVIPLDPWGTPYQYAYPGTHSSTSSTTSGQLTTTTVTTGGHYDLWSLGPNKIDGDSDDIISW